MVLFHQSNERLHNPLCRTAIPAIWDIGWLPCIIGHISHGLAQLVGILAYQDICTLFHCLNVLRIAVQRSARHIVEGRFFGDITRIGDNAAGIGQQIGKVKVAQWLNYV